MGFIPLPLGVLTTRIISQAVEISNWAGGVILVLAFMCLVSFRILSNIVTLGKACDLIDTHQKQRAAAATSSSSSGSSEAVYITRFDFEYNRSPFIGVTYASVATSPRPSRPEKRANSIEDIDTNTESPVPATFIRSMSIDVSQLSPSPEKSTAAPKIRSVSHSPPRIVRRMIPQQRRGVRACASPQIPPEIPELGCQPMFSNSTVSLNSVCLNEEVLDEASEHNLLSGHSRTDS